MSQHCGFSLTTMAMTIVYYLLASSCLAVFGSAIASQNANSTTRRDLQSSMITNNDLPERTTTTTTAPTNISSTSAMEYVEKAELSLIYWRAALVGGGAGLFVSLFISISAGCIIYRMSQTNSRKYTTEYSRLLASHSTSASLASFAQTSNSMPGSPKYQSTASNNNQHTTNSNKKVKERKIKTLPNRRSVLALSDSEHNYACMSGVKIETESPKAVYKKKVSTAMQPPKLLAELKKKHGHGSMPNLAELQGMSISRQKSADEVLSRPRAYTAADETAAAGRLSAIYTEPDSVTIRQGRRSQESDGTMYYNTNSIISTSTDIYTMSDFTDLSRNSDESKTPSHYTTPYIPTSPTNNTTPPFKAGSVGYANGAFMVNNKHHSDQVLSARDLHRKPVLSPPTQGDFPFGAKLKPRSNTGL